MNVYLRGWKTVGLRCPDMEIDLGSRTDQNQVSLIQMPNGTGKSTIIELLNACLTGEKLSYERVLALQAAHQKSDTGRFELNLIVQEETKQKASTLDIVLAFDFITGDSQYSTLRDVSAGLELGWRPPIALQPFLNDRCVDVFVFKGDRVETLLDRTRNDAEASIKAFFGISAIEDLIAEVDKEFATRQYQSGTTDATLTRKRNELQRWEARLAGLQSELKRLESQHRDAERDYADKREVHRRLIERQTENAAKFSRLQEEIAAATVKLSEASANALAAMRNPLFVSEYLQQTLAELKINLDTLKLPGTSLEFFRELTEHPNCICDRDMSVEARDSILRNAESYLSDDHVGVVNGIKKDFATYSSKAITLRDNNLFEQLRDSASSLRQKQQQFARLKKAIHSEATEEERGTIDRWEEAVRGLNALKIAIAELSGDGDISASLAMKGGAENCRNIPTTQAVITQKSRELSESLNTVGDFNAKEKLKRILQRSAELSLLSIGKQLTIESNKKLKKILPRGTNLRILSAAKNISLGFDGHRQDRGSGGQNVAVAYSFSTSILEKSGVQFPLIVDHPVTALQESARREMGSSLAKICHQFVGFIIDTEKEGLVEALKASGAVVNYITVYRNIEGNRPYDELLPKDRKLVNVTKDATMCMDYDFFMQFRDLHREIGAVQNVQN